MGAKINTVWNILNEIRETPGQHADLLIGEALRKSALPVVDLGDGLRAVVAPPRNTYQTKVFVWPRGQFVRCQAATDMVIERELLGREVDSRETTASELQKLNGDLLARFEQMVARLYGMDLIIEGPEPSSPTSSGR
jgi:hypothetical protein